MVIAVTLLILATGVCLFDEDEHDGAGRAAALDLCLGMLAVSLAAMPFVVRLTTGRAVGSPVPAVYLVALRIPDPPPRPAIFR